MAKRKRSKKRPQPRHKKQKKSQHDKRKRLDRRNPKHRVGGGLTAPVLPHHRTYGSVYGGSVGTSQAS